MFKRNRNKKMSSAVRKNILPKKSVSKRYISRLSVLVLVVAGLFGARQAMQSLELFPIKQVRIEGEFIHLDKEDLKLKISSYTQTGFFEVDIAKLRKALVKVEWVEDAFVRRAWPDAVVIRVVEKEPIAKWNRQGVLTSTNDLFYPQDKKNIKELVELSGPEGRHAFVLSEFNFIQSLLRQADIEISSLSQNIRRSWKMQVDGIEVNLGRKDIYKKVESFAVIYQSLLQPRINKIRQIDFRYTNGFAVRWKDEVSDISKIQDRQIINGYQNKMNEDFLMGAVKNV